MRRPSWSQVVTWAMVWLLGAGCAAAQQNHMAGQRSAWLATHKLDCISADKVRNEYTPPDLMAAYSKCTIAGRYDDAVELRLIAAAYSHYDTLRVLDKSSHDVFGALMQHYPPRNEDVGKLKAADRKYSDAKSAESLKFCKDIVRIGPPNYYPTYMVTHGSTAYYATGPFTKDIVVQDAWKETLAKFARCAE